MHPKTQLGRLNIMREEETKGNRDFTELLPFKTRVSNLLMRCVKVNTTSS